MTRQKWIFFGVLAFAAALVASYFLWRYGTHYCIGLKTANLARELKDRAPIDCREFWINRYQSAWSAILGTAGTLLAAGIAWIAVQRQIAQGRFQMLIAQWQAATATMAAMSRDRQLISDARSFIIPAARDHIQRTLSPWQDKVLDHYYMLGERAASCLFEVSAAGSPWSLATSQTREKLLLAFRQLQAATYEMRYELSAQAAAATVRREIQKSTEQTASHQRAGKEAAAILARAELGYDEFVQQTAREIVPFSDFCERLRQNVFAH